MCPIKRAKYLSKLNNFIDQGYPIVYMDESGFEAETIRPYGYAPRGKPCIERYNRTMRYDWLNQELFTDLNQVRQQAEAWLYHYSNERSNMGNGGFTPIQKLNRAA